MKKIDMYQEVPERFHNKLCDTLEQLEEKKIVRFSAKHYVLLCAVLILALSAISVGAVELFKWYRAASEQFGTTEELENKLTNQGMAIPETDSDEDKDITISALQAVKKDDDYYLLAAFKWPADLQWNNDILFEECDIVSEQEFDGCVANFAGVPDENGMVYVEIDVRGKMGTEYTEEIVVVLKNLIRTAKTEYASTVVEAEWELVYRLPTGEDFNTFYVTQMLPAAGHELEIEQVEVSPFGVRLYTEEAEARHAVYYSDIQLAAAEYEDGSLVETYGAYLRFCAAKDEMERFYFNLPLQTTVDVDKVSGLVFKEGDDEYKIKLGEQAILELQTAEVTDETATLCELSKCENVTELQILYVRYGHVVLTDNQNIYLWDARCNTAENLMKLADYGYDVRQGGDIAMMPGGVVLAMKPTTNSDKIYMLDMEMYDVIEADAEEAWPVPRAEDYEKSFFKVADRNDLPEGVYAEEGYEEQEGVYVLYSTDGKIENMKLMDLNKI